MSTWTVKATGGDYPSLNLALANASTVNGDTIEISGEWTDDDSTAATILDDLTINVVGDAKHPGYYDASLKHYRLKTTSSSDSLTLFGNYTATIDGIVIEQAGTTDSAEACDVRPGTSDSVTISNCIVLCSTSTTQQDCIYTGYNSNIGPVNVVQCILYGANRGGINIQNSSGVNTYSATINVNSSTIWGCGLGAAATQSGAGGIVFLYAGGGTNIAINVHNSIVIGNTTGTAAADYYSDGNTVDPTWDVSYSCDSDNSINGVLGADGTGNLKNRVPLDTTASGASEVLFEDLTTVDLRLQDNDTYNTAQDAHSVQTDAGMTIPDNDIVGTSRNSAGTPQQGTDFDIGAFEVVVAAGVAVLVRFLSVNKSKLFTSPMIRV